MYIVNAKTGRLKSNDKEDINWGGGQVLQIIIM